jgi:FkbM family methyltransferase
MSDVCLRGKSSLFYEEGLSNLIVKLLKVPPRPPPGTERNKKSPTPSRSAATHKDKLVSLKVIDDSSEAGPSLLLTKPWLLDIGASIGMHTLSAAKAGFPVMAIESSPESIARLRCSLGLNGLKSTILLNVGAGYPTNGDKLCVKSHDDTNAAKNFVTPCSSSTPPSKNDVKVPMLTLDDLFFSLLFSRLPPPTVVKLNVEGFEAWVLSGGGNFVAEFRPPYFLLVANPFLLERAGGFWQHLLAFFYQHKYNVYSLGNPGEKITQFDYDSEEKNAALLNALGRCNYKLIIRRDDGVWPVSWPLSICDPS